MSARRTKGTTLIELMITTAMAAMILSAIYMLWAGNTATARQCGSLSDSLNQAQLLTEQLDRQLANLVFTGDSLPVEIESHSGLVKLKLHTRFNTENNIEQPGGPFIAEYVLDIQTGLLKYRQRAALSFSEEINDKNKWQETRTEINGLELDYFNGEKWDKLNELKSNAQKKEPVSSLRVSLKQKTTAGEMQYSVSTIITESDIKRQ